jgi:nucleolysin TIA-1/TIAR
MTANNCSQWGKDKTPTGQGGFDPVQSYSPQSAQAPGFPGTPTYYPQYGGECNMIETLVE